VACSGRFLAHRARDTRSPLLISAFGYTSNVFVGWSYYHTDSAQAVIMRMSRGSVVSTIYGRIDKAPAYLIGLFDAFLDSGKTLPPETSSSQ
jgi:hypothetical protein